MKTQGLIDRQLDFLPAALAVQERPPSPVSHWLLVVLLSLFAASLAWACVGEVDIVVTAPGRIVPTGQVKRVQAHERGTVAAILVAEGDRVAAGQALVRLDPTYADADNQGISTRLAEAGLQLSWRRELAAWMRQPRVNLALVEVSTADAATDEAMAQALYQQHRAEIVARVRGVEQQRAANRAEQQMAIAERAKVEAALDILEERVGAHKALLDKQYGSRVQYLELLQAQTELEWSIPVLEARLAQLVETGEALASNLRALLGDYRKQNLLELARLEAEISALEQELRKTNQHRQQQVLSAPVAGTVHALATHTVGGVVTPAQELMQIVPREVSVEVEANLQNRDIGFVTEGQRAQIKVDTFNFTKYGLIDARVANIGNDAIEDQQHGWVFKTRLTLDKDRLAVEDRVVRLSPGMAITAEIKTGKRRLIEFFLSPLLRYRQESARER